jgi:hypothetical protein
VAEASLDLIQAMLQRLVDGQRQTHQDLADLKERMGAVELGLIGVRRELVGLAEADARLGIRVDHLESRLERIERRLDLHDGPPAAAE